MGISSSSSPPTDIKFSGSKKRPAREFTQDPLPPVKKVATIATAIMTQTNRTDNSELKTPLQLPAPPRLSSLSAPMNFSGPFFLDNP